MPQMLASSHHYNVLLTYHFPHFNLWIILKANFYKNSGNWCDCNWKHSKDFIEIRGITRNLSDVKHYEHVPWASHFSSGEIWTREQFFKIAYGIHMHKAHYFPTCTWNNGGRDNPASMFPTHIKIRMRPQGHMRSAQWLCSTL